MHSRSTTSVAAALAREPRPAKPLSRPLLGLPLGLPLGLLPIVLLALLALSGCGQKGPLTLPAASTAASAPGLR